MVIGITFTLITVRVGLGWGQETKTTTASMRWAGNATSSLSHDRQRRRRTDPERPQAISLIVTRGTESRNDGVDGEQSSVADIGKANPDDSLPQRSRDTFGGTV